MTYFKSSENELITVVELSEFRRRAKGRLSEQEQFDCIGMIAADPECGEVMSGTGGVRKVRLATRGRGKSGSTRIVYYYRNRSIPAFLITVFAKNEKDNLSKAERNALSKLVRILARYGETK